MFRKNVVCTVLTLLAVLVFGLSTAQAGKLLLEATHSFALYDVNKSTGERIQLAPFFSTPESWLLGSASTGRFPEDLPNITPLEAFETTPVPKAGSSSSNQTYLDLIKVEPTNFTMSLRLQGPPPDGTRSGAVRASVINGRIMMTLSEVGNFNLTLEDKVDYKYQVTNSDITTPHQFYQSNALLTVGTDESEDIDYFKKSLGSINDFCTPLADKTFKNSALLVTVFEDSYTSVLTGNPYNLYIDMTGGLEGYTGSCPVPIPGGILLLGSALLRFVRVQKNRK